jgi:hypothetical protein
MANATRHYQVLLRLLAMVLKALRQGMVNHHPLITIHQWARQITIITDKAEKENKPFTQWAIATTTNEPPLAN